MKKLKILLLCQASPISTSAYYLRALRRAHHVTTCGPRINLGMVDQWKAWEHDHALKTPGCWEDDKYGLLTRLALLPDIEIDEGYRLIQPKPGQPPYDLVLWIDGGPEMRIIPERFGCPTACLLIDTHTDPHWRLELAEHYTHTFLASKIDADKRAGAYWLPVAADPQIHRPYDVQEAYDIVFVGQTSRQWHPRRVERLEHLRAAGLDVRVDSKILDEMALLLCRGRIAFNGALNDDLNMRVFEALACGRLLLTDHLSHRSGLEGLFTDHQHLALYNTSDHLIDLAQHYLANPAERLKIAAAGRREVLAKHTYAHRADQLLATVFGPGACASCVEAQNEQA